MKILQLSQGEQAKICDCHYYLASGKKWHYKDGYASRTIYDGGGRKNLKNHHETLHRLVAGAKKGEVVDHINQDKLDNSCTNLRIVTHQINIVNRGRQSNNTSGYRGVQYRRDRNKWVAILGHNGKYRKLGSFDAPESASKVYEAERAKVWSGVCA